MTFIEIFFTLILFFIILLIYVHIQNHYKTNDTMEIFEYEYVSNIQLQDICDLKQPILFNFYNNVPELFQDVSTSFFSNFSNTDIFVKDIDDYWKKPSPTSVDSIPLSFKSFINLTHKDEKKQ